MTGGKDIIRMTETEQIGRYGLSLIRKSADALCMKSTSGGGTIIVAELRLLCYDEESKNQVLALDGSVA